MAEIWKSYDVRGIYPSEVNEGVAESIGRAVVGVLHPGEVLVGEDVRSSSPALRDALVRGLTESGADVTLLGAVSTPMLYFASSHLGAGAAIMVTASHNPGEYNGFKICGKNAVALGLASGLGDIRDAVRAEKFPVPERVGTIRKYDIKREYLAMLQKYAEPGGKPLKIAIDAAHAMGVLEIPALESGPHTIVASLYDTLKPPGTCPHEANPMLPETLLELSRAVKDSGADLGVAFDGDADRVGFLDERGAVVPMDIVTALLSKEILKTHPGRPILADLRSSRAVFEAIDEAGGRSAECKVGHANIKKQMREEGAIMAGEASGHYYFALEGYTAEMGALPGILLMNLLSREGRPLSSLVSEVMRYHHSGEINFRVSDPKTMIELVRKKYADGILSTLDGIKISYQNWWLSLRASNTEPLLRLNLEADTKALLDEKRGEVTQLIEGGV